MIELTQRQVIKLVETLLVHGLPMYKSLILKSNVHIAIQETEFKNHHYIWNDQLGDWMYHNTTIS